jgi:PGF-CTERM protein
VTSKALFLPGLFYYRRKKPSDFSSWLRIVTWTWNLKPLRTESSLSTATTLRLKQEQIMQILKLGRETPSLLARKLKTSRSLSSNHISKEEEEEIRRQASETATAAMPETPTTTPKVRVEPPPFPPTPTPTPPGFEAVFAIAGLLAVAYPVLRRKRK